MVKSENTSRMLNAYFLTVFTEGNLATIPERVEAYEGDNNDKLRDVVITR